MEFIVASVENMKFNIEIALEEQHGCLPLPFSGMDKSIAGVCEFFPKGSCAKGTSCPLRHVKGDRTIVCKHWLRGLCKKGDLCEFLHEYDMTKMPECYFYSRFNACHNKECPFLHIDPESKIKDCPWYDRGFCRHGPNCRHRHVRRVLCINYLAGFCSDGPECKFMHPRFELPAADVNQKEGKKVVIVCHFCGESGHKALYCHKMPADMKEAEAKQLGVKVPQFITKTDESGKEIIIGTKPALKPLEEVTCFKCGCKGHYANKCPKGHLAFLALSQNQNQPNPQYIKRLLS
ncbi:cleavage and polyadenylation specificity factor subunit 4-like [Macrosteles quadrilineatus]|uniref:cleavage and polyadenylation specificity factor subunit 4-like n=1 Tax=Macrosteles quadrilineatus TaxID=74068 RepID=UPI0023E0D58C|nr:cleavage and polyadenylation specificity factor subunit 4-like [Macrosteles quadrilineatus]XP_054283936.1 cleavage and polyadenylation specificity factor subunit 4-like [Macrosteles quadrilineatus]